jgi:hypothetical protein
MENPRALRDDIGRGRALRSPQFAVSLKLMTSSDGLEVIKSHQKSLKVICAGARPAETG